MPAVPHPTRLRGTPAIKKVGAAGLARFKAGRAARPKPSVGQPHSRRARSLQPLPYNNRWVPGAIRFDQSRLRSAPSVRKATAGGFELYEQRHLKK